MGKVAPVDYYSVMIRCLAIFLLWVTCDVQAGRVVDPDPFEPDNTVLGGQATFLIDGEPQIHWFHRSTDLDWFVMDAFLGEDNIVEIAETIPPGRTDPPELTLNVRVYDAASYCYGFCINLPFLEINACASRPSTGSPVPPINLSTRAGLLANAVFILVRDCYGTTGEDRSYTIELLERPDPPLPEQCQEPGACVPRALAANLNGQVVLAGSGQPIGGVLVQTSSNITTFSKLAGPLEGQFSMLVEAGTNAAPVTLQIGSDTFQMLSVTPTPLGPYAEGEVVTGVEITVQPGSVVFASGFDL